MSNVVISYNRESEAIVRALANDIEKLGHEAWFDQELSGGQAWWEQILARVRDCDVLVFALSPQALNSTACRREFDYAAALGKPIVPVLVAQGVSTNLLPPALSAIHLVDHREQDRDAAFRLARALNAVPPPKPLPDPLPDPPEVPISYLGGLAEQVGSASPLEKAEQSALLVDLKRSYRESETMADAGKVLNALRRRHDLFAVIAEEIDELLGRTTRVTSVPAGAPKPGAPKREPNLHSVALNRESWPPSPKLKIFVASSGKADENVMGTIRSVLHEFSDKLDLHYWKESSTSGNINLEILRQVKESQFGLCYFSEPVDDPNSKYMYQDNINVVFEAGMFQSLTNPDLTDYPVGWIPIREQESPPPPFDFAQQLMIIVERLANGKPNIDKLRGSLKDRINDLLR